MVNLEYFRDRDEISSLPCDLVTLMKHQGLIAPDQIRIHYCGFISHKQGIAVFMPRNTSLESLLPHHAFYLFQCLNRYYIGKKTGVSEGQESELIGKESLSLLYSLIEDYRTNGLYVRRRKNFSLNQGRPNWKRTMSRQTPYPSSDSPVYLVTDTSRINYVSDCETSRIHAHVIRSIYRKYGLIITGDNITLDISLDKVPMPNLGIENQITVLEQELTESYSERDIQLIGMLKSYIEEFSKVAGSELLVGTRKFHNVWEGMLDKCLPNKVNINSKLPVPYYQQDAHFVEVSRKGQRTDTVIESKDCKQWAIIDAKYYNASSPNLAPGWHDLVKQFFYKTALESICNKGVRITLHFIFPGNNEYLKKVKIGNRKQKNTLSTDFIEVEQYGEILCHYCDPLILIEKYSRGRVLDIYNKRHITGDVFTIDKT